MRRLMRVTGLLVVAAAVFATAGIAGGGSKTTWIDQTYPSTLCGADITIHDLGHFVSTITNGVETDRYEMKSTFTSDVNGAVVIFHEEGQQTYPLVPLPNSSGGYTAVVSYQGSPEQIKLQNGGMLTRDTGQITITDTFDANMNFLAETITTKGPHPEADSGFALECQLLGPILNG